MAETPASRRPLTVLMGAETFPPDTNGAANFAARLAAGLIERGHDVHVAAPAPSRVHGTFTEQHEGAYMTVHRYRSWRWPWHHWVRFALPWRTNANGARLMEEVQPDVVHFQSHIVVGRGLAHAAKKRGIRVIGTNHIMPENLVQHIRILPDPLVRLVVWFEWRSARKWYGSADAATTPTRNAADYLERHAHISGVLAISCGIDSHLYTPRIGPKPDKRIVFVGRVDDEKHLQELVEAFGRLEQSLGATLTIVGDGDQRDRLAQLASDLGVTDRVRFTGRISDEELRAELTAATVFAIASRAELQSIATLEAMSSGLPVVAANAMALPHLVHDGENGYLYEPGDIDGFAERLRRVLTAPDDEYERMQRASLEVVTHHDISRTIDTFEALYRGEPLPEPPRRAGSAATTRAD
jgi:glycosyltransferase involved in cell wall biosynthesis